MSFIESKITYYYHDTIGYSVFTSPTGNCQLFSIAEARLILNRFTNDEDVKKEFQNSGNRAERKKIALIDVKQQYCNRIDKIFKTSIISKTLYESTNGSEMCIYLIKISYGLYD